MRYAIFGDIHANWEALMAVMEDASAQRCTHFACLGDIVGYNANPSECLDYVRNLGCAVVKGNHDEAAAGNHPLEDLNPFAERALLWTRKHLTDEQKQWLASLNLVQQVEGFTIVHATLESPGSWTYITNKYDALVHFSFQTHPVCFYGHTHVPRIYENGESIRSVRESFIQVRPDMKYLVNVGSVGQSRDGDWRASYGIYDLEKNEISLRRVNFDRDTAQQKTRNAGLGRDC